MAAVSGIGRRPAGATALIPEGLEPLAVWDAWQHHELLARAARG